MIKDRNVNIITDEDNHKVILINDIMFKGKRNHLFVQGKSIQDLHPEEILQQEDKEMAEEKACKEVSRRHQESNAVQVR